VHYGGGEEDRQETKQRTKTEGTNKEEREKALRLAHNQHPEVWGGGLHLVEKSTKRSEIPTAARNTGDRSCDDWTLA